MNEVKVKCVCGQECDLESSAIIKGKGYVSGHKRCVKSLSENSDYLLKHLWEDGSGSYGPGWMADVKRRRVVGQGEVIRDYGRTYHYL